MVWRGFPDQTPMRFSWSVIDSWNQKRTNSVQQHYRHVAGLPFFHSICCGSINTPCSSCFKRMVEMYAAGSLHHWRHWQICGVCWRAIKSCWLKLDGCSRHNENQRWRASSRISWAAPRDLHELLHKYALEVRNPWIAVFNAFLCISVMLLAHEDPRETCSLEWLVTFRLRSQKVENK